MKIAVHSYFVSERQILCKREETTGEGFAVQTRCCCGSAGPYVGTCTLGENIRQALTSPVSSCPAATEREI